MGVRFPSVSTNSGLGVYGAAGAEFLVLTTPPLNIPLDFAQVFLVWFITFNVGTGTTSVTIRIRRGATLTGLAINLTLATTVTAGVFNAFSGCYFDTPGAVAGQQYSLTVAGTGTTGAGAPGDNALLAFAL